MDNMIITKNGAGSQKNSGTTFYKVSLPDLIDMLRKLDANIIMIGALEMDGWSCIDFEKNLFGSAVIDDDLYLCKTNGKDIIVNGEEVDPEYALEEYTLEELSDYIADATPEDIRLEITPYEVTNFDIEDVALDQLQAGVSFRTLVHAAEDYMD